MGTTAPLELSRLLHADTHDREAAWEELIGGHTRLLLATSRSFGGDNDAVMERYAYILGKLRENEFRRLRTFNENAGATFSTWLTVTARRLCLDLHRSQYGRKRETHDTDRSTVLRAARKALNELPVIETDADSIADEASQVDDHLIHLDRDQCLQQALARLTPRERFLLTLRFEDDLPAARIATILGLPSPFHVYRKLNGILASLRRQLESRGIENSDG
jgi:RNA polymerase sigma factor (sigma-70 family)